MYRFLDSEINPEPTVRPRNSVLLNQTSFTKTSSSGLSDYIDMHNVLRTISRTLRLSHLPGDWWVYATTNTNTPIPNLSNPVMDPDEEVQNISRNIINTEEPKFYRQTISGPKVDLWHSAIEAAIDVLQHNLT
jgi:hypothetical protein